jgi:hypothetical protein
MKEELLKRIVQYAQNDPSIYGDLMKLVSDNWKEMVEAEKNKRESSHAGSLVWMLDHLWTDRIHGKKNPRLFSQTECCELLDPISSVMPEGVGYSSAQGQLLALFAESCRALGWEPEQGFISDIRDKSKFLTALYKNYPVKRKAA